MSVIWSRKQKTATSVHSVQNHSDDRSSLQEFVGVLVWWLSLASGWFWVVSPISAGDYTSEGLRRCTAGRRVFGEVHLLQSRDGKSRVVQVAISHGFKGLGLAKRKIKSQPF